MVVDGSETGRRALDRALQRARERGTSVTLLAIVPPRLWRAKQAQFQASPDKHDEEFARGLLSEAKQICKREGVRCAGRLRAGPPADVITEEAGRGFDGVILGERRRTTGAPSLGAILRARLAISVEVVEEDDGR